MAQWHLTEILLERPIPQKNLEKLNKALQVLDYDTPEIKSSGISLDQEVAWRSPLFKLQETLNAIHWLTGIPCSGRRFSDHKYLEDPNDAFLDEETKSEEIPPKTTDIDLLNIRKIYGKPNI